MDVIVVDHASNLIVRRLASYRALVLRMESDDREVQVRNHA